MRKPGLTSGCSLGGLSGDDSVGVKRNWMFMISVPQVGRSYHLSLG